MDDREKTVYLARLAEQAERYEDMIQSMKDLVKLNVLLTKDERNLLSVAYKNHIGLRRTAWRTLSSLEQKEAEDISHISKYKTKVEEEIEGICDDIFDLLDTHLIPSVSNLGEEETIHEKEALVFYYKMKGDYLRYVAELKTGIDQKEAAENALVAYKTATDHAVALPVTHPVRLGLALNFSVFYYEILNSPPRACRMAQQAFDDALDDYQELTDDESKDCKLIMQLLRDNITLWTADDNEKGTEEETARLEEVNDGE